MKKKIAEQWVRALRSGRYKQGKDCLREHTPDGLRYCCLGVLCRISKLGNFTADDYYYTGVAVKNDESNQYLPEGVQKWAKMYSPEGHTQDEIGTNEESLVDLNDSGKTFREIAKYIETNYKKL